MKEALNAGIQVCKGEGMQPTAKTEGLNYSLRVKQLLLAQPLNPLKKIQFNIAPRLVKP